MSTKVDFKCSACGRPAQGYANQLLFHGNCPHRKRNAEPPKYVVVAK